MNEVARIAEAYQGYQQTDAMRKRWSDANPGNRRILQERRDTLDRLLNQTGYQDRSKLRVLEIGCGTGKVMQLFFDLGFKQENFCGIDLLPDRITESKAVRPELQVFQSNAEHLPFQDQAFDLVVAFTVFSSILDPQMAQNAAAECQRVLGPNGAMIWYDFRVNNPKNPDVQGMTRKAIGELFPQSNVELRTITLLPPLARRLGPLTTLMYPGLSKLPFLRTHHLAILQANGS